MKAQALRHQLSAAALRRSLPQRRLRTLRRARRRPNKKLATG